MNDVGVLQPARMSRKQAAALASIAASALLAVAKLAAGLWSGSLSLLSEAGHAGVDTGATLLTYFAVREGDKPADAEHHYGHGKFESLAALAETGLLFGLALFVVGEAVRRLLDPAEEIDAGWPVFAVLGVSIAVDFLRAWQLNKIAQQEGSDALAADALHFSSDLVSSALVLIGLGATRFGFLQGDALAALGVAGFIAIAGYRLGKRTIETLLDAAPRELVPGFEKLLKEAPGVIALEELRLRKVGANVFGEARIGVSRGLSIEQAARIKEAAIAAIAAQYPRASLTLIAEPRALDDETVVERIFLVAARRALPVHHIVAQQIGETLSIGLDLELDPNLALSDAHAIATQFESALRDEFGAGVEVETHIEPLVPHLLQGCEATTEAQSAISEALAREAAWQGLVRHVHDVRVRRVDSGLVVNYHCELDGRVGVKAAHDAVDLVERRLREQFPSILRVVGHMEPFDGVSKS